MKFHVLVEERLYCHKMPTKKNTQWFTKKAVSENFISGASGTFSHSRSQYVYADAFVPFHVLV